MFSQENIGFLENLGFPEKTYVFSENLCFLTVSRENLGFLAENPGFLTENPGFLTENLGFLTENLGFLTENLGFLGENPGFLVFRTTDI